MPPRTPVSVVLAEVLADLLRDTPEEQVTLDWLMSRPGDRSFGVLLLLLALLGLLPGVSAAAGVLLTVPAAQMALARAKPVFPRRVAMRRIQARRPARVIRSALPTLRWLEQFIHPRWAMPLEATTRVVGGGVIERLRDLIAEEKR
jgi:hypothetical protein